MSEKKRIISKFEIVLLVIGVGLLAYLGLRSNGIHLVKTTETTELVNNPKAKKKQYQKKKRTVEEERLDHEIENMLRQLDSRKGNKRPLQVANTPSDKRQMSPDETKFFKEVAKEYKSQEEDREIDWLSVLSASRKTYSKVKDVFRDPNEAPKSEAEELVEDVSSLLKNEMVASSIYSKLENMFSIPEDKSREFAEKGKQAVSDWAKFVEENKEKN